MGKMVEDERGMVEDERRMMQDHRTAIFSFLIESRTRLERAAQHDLEGTGRLLVLFHCLAEAVGQRKAFVETKTAKQ